METLSSCPPPSISQRDMNELDFFFARYRAGTRTAAITLSDVGSTIFNGAIQEALEVQGCVRMLLELEDKYPDLVSQISGHFDVVKKQSERDLSTLKNLYVSKGLKSRAFEKLTADIQTEMDKKHD